MVTFVEDKIWLEHVVAEPNLWETKIIYHDNIMSRYKNWLKCINNVMNKNEWTKRAQNKWNEKTNQ